MGQALELRRGVWHWQSPHPDWSGRKHVTRGEVVNLRPLLQLPVELVLPAHGEPSDRMALVRVFS